MKTCFLHELNDSESKKKFFEKIFLNDPKSRKSPIFNIFWTAPTNLLIFSGMIALDSAFQHIIPVCPGKLKKFYKKIKNCQKIHVFVIIEWSRFFLGNPAVLRHSGRCFLTSCQKSWKSLGGKYHNFFARGARILVICSTEVENSVLYTPRDNSSHNSRTGLGFDLWFSR